MQDFYIMVTEILVKFNVVSDAPMFGYWERILA
jgi:hypothetical protein